jgi:hypothetical protein
VSHRRKVQRFAAARNAEHMTVADVSRSVCKRAHSLVPNDAVAALAQRAAEIDVGSLSRPGVYVLLWRGEVVYVGQSIEEKLRSLGTTGLRLIREALGDR